MNAKRVRSKTSPHMDSRVGHRKSKGAIADHDAFLGLPYVPLHCRLMGSLNGPRAAPP